MYHRDGGTTDVVWRLGRQFFEQRKSKAKPCAQCEMRIQSMPFRCLFKQHRCDTSLLRSKAFIKILDRRDLRPAGFTFKRPLVHSAN
jgi:hypothetical protein